MTQIIRIPEGVGWIETITGPMFSGKSEELLRRIKRALIAKHKVQVFKPLRDTRSGISAIESRNGLTLEAIGVDEIEAILGLVHPDTQVAGIDEGQFFDDPLDPTAGHTLRVVVEALADQGKRVIVAGLDQDYRGLPMRAMVNLMAVAESRTTCFARCFVCGSPAFRSILLDKPEGVFTIGDADKYEARCRAHSRVEQGRTVT